MKKWLKSPWGISIGTSVFGFLLTVGYDILKEKPVFNTIWSILKLTWKGIITFLNFDLKVWWILIGIAMIILALYIALKISDAKNSEISQSDILKYTTDVISGWHWEWRWEKGYDRKFGIEGLHPVCSRCNTPLVYEERYGDIICPRCNSKPGNKVPDEDIVKTMIYDNIKKGLYPKACDRT